MLKVIEDSGVGRTYVTLMDGFEQADWGEVQTLADMIKDDRSQHLNYRSDDQVYAEAEVLYIIKRLRKGTYRAGSDIDRAYFLSQSNVLNRVAQDDYVTTWTPELAYRDPSSAARRTS